MRKLHSATVLLALGGVALSPACGSCGAAEGDGGDVSHGMTLAASAHDAPADGLTQVTLTAKLPNAPAGAVVHFEVAGVGLLASTNELVDAAGSSSVKLYAPFESDLGSQASATAAVTATASFDPTITATTTVTFGVPSTGAPTLSVRADPDRVVAGSGDAITLIIDGRRLASADVGITTLPSDAVTMPATFALDEVEDGVFHGEIVIVAPEAPADVAVHVASGADAFGDVMLHFTAPDAPQFDLSGTFAEVQYGVVKIGDLIFLDPDPQCVVAPTLILAHVTQSGRHVTIDTQTCDVQMPAVSVILVGQSTTTVGPGFVDATNASGSHPIEIDLDGDVGPGAQFTPNASSFDAPLVVGADLADPVNDDLPTTADDARVTDDDHDGNPGVTVTNSNQGDQFCVFRTTTSTMNGTITDSDAIDGVVDGVTETNILNGGGGGLAPTVTGKPSPFHFRRVDGRNGAPDIAGRDGDPSSISCDDVNAFAAELEDLAAAPDTSTACD